MFTGIIEGKGRVLKVEDRGRARRLTLDVPGQLTGIKPGDSINVNGACLTVTEKDGGTIQVDLSSETLERTTLGEVREGEALNLERALTLSDRLGGHIVTGHVDGVGVITEKRQDQEFLHLKIRLPENALRYIVRKGSVAIDGISLTVNECSGMEIQMALIPFTLEKTTLGGKKAGDRVNIETDILGKYVEKALDRGGHGSHPLDLSFLREHGFIKGD